MPWGGGGEGGNTAAFGLLGWTLAGLTNITVGGACTDDVSLRAARWRSTRDILDIVGVVLIVSIGAVVLIIRRGVAADSANEGVAPQVVVAGVECHGYGHWLRQGIVGVQAIPVWSTGVVRDFTKVGLPALPHPMLREELRLGPAPTLKLAALALAEQLLLHSSTAQSQRQPHKNNKDHREAYDGNQVVA